MTNNNQDATASIYHAVQAHYGNIAQGTQSGCCGDDCECGASTLTFYESSALVGLPEAAKNLSLGCGDPVTIANILEGETVLDLGSGAGINCFMAAQQVGAHGHVIGVDMTPAMLEQANANKARMGLENVEFRSGQIEALPVENDSIDLIMSNCVINLSPDKARVFAEAYRVLKPGGRISISDMVTDGDFSQAMRANMEQWSECVSGAIDVSLYTRMMADAGFEDILIVDKTDATSVINMEAGMPRVYSARITARKLQ